MERGIHTSESIVLIVCLVLAVCSALWLPTLPREVFYVGGCYILGRSVRKAYGRRP